jgi:hypothetical protein
MNSTSKDHQSASKQEQEQSYPVPAEGSLGLLALGWRGLKFWRAAREAAKKGAGNEQKS